jgi:pilus assembly protein CpaC
LGSVVTLLGMVWAAEPLAAQPLPGPVPGGGVPAPAVQGAAAEGAAIQGAAAPAAIQGGTPVTAAPGAAEVPLVYRVQAVQDHLEMTVNSSRILTLDQKIPQAQVNNPDVLDLVPLSPNQVQISARKAGVTQVNLWGEDKRIFTVSVVVFGDARELRALLQTLFPKAALTLVPAGNAITISGFVDDQNAVPKIVRVAEEYYPKVINNMTVSGVQQVLLRVKVMEVSRTKLRNLGFDFAKITNGNVVASGISGLIQTTAGIAATPGYTTNTDQAVKAYLFHNNSAFFCVLQALRTDGLAKILTEPNLTAVSGRPAYILEGGEFGYTVSNISGTTVQFKEYGTRVDMVPIVLGNGRIHLEVRARVSERDDADGVQGIPAIKERETETGVELRAGQTLAIAGLLQQLTEASSTGLPWISEVPYIGALFRTVQHSTNEVELVIMVTPELVDAMDASQVPPCGPGMNSADPSDWELFAQGHLEVPKCCAGGNCAAAATAGGPYNPPSPSRPNVAVPDPAVPAAAAGSTEPPFLGPTGYDDLN